MDFGRPLVSEPSVASQSNIRYLEVPSPVVPTGSTSEEERDRRVDQEVVQAANDTAKSIFLGPVSGHVEITADNAWMLDASYYPDRMTKKKNKNDDDDDNLIQAGDLVVIQESFDRLDFVYCQPGAIYNNRNGHFYHDDFIDKKPFGTKLRSRNLEGYGFIYLLKPTPELWTRSLNHRTQIVHELDQSQIVWQLWLRPNQTVVESGTGSGALSHSLLRTIAPAGHLHTFEFSRHRAHEARREFQQHGLQHLVTVHHKDVCHGVVVDDDNDDGDNNNSDKGEEDETVRAIVDPSVPGFDLPEASVDAVVLDLPEPWVAVPHAALVLRPDARIASYSPCVEQTQRTVAALQEHGFHSMQTFEYRLKEYYVDATVTFESLPTAKRPRHEPHNVDNYTNTATTTATTSPSNPKSTKQQNGNSESGETKPTKSWLVARPVSTTRGHTAFLTFATRNPAGY